MSARILLINQYFWPDYAATAQLLYDLAEAAAESRFEVTALAGRGYYARPADMEVPERFVRRGITVHRVWSTGFGRRRTLGRLADYATYFLSAAVWLLSHRTPDVVVCLSTPPLVAVLGLLPKIRGARFVYKVEDLYPDVAVALGTLRERSALTASLRALSRFLFRRADACVALDHSMAARLKRRGARRVEVIPNWADGEAIYPDADAGRRFRDAEGLDGRFLVLYSGNMGLAHRFDAIVGAIHLLEEEKAPIQFLFVGDGARLPELRGRLEPLPSVRFLPYQPRERLRELYNAADVHLVSLRDELAGSLVPSKYAAALAGGRPVLLVGGSGTEMAGEIENEGLGFAVPHHVEDVANALRKCLAHGATSSKRAAQIRLLLDRKYSKKALLPAWLELLCRMDPIRERL